MYDILMIIQWIGLFLVIFEIVYIVFKQKSSQVQALLIVMCLAILINNASYMLQMQAKTLGEAMIAVKTSYVGKPYIVLTVFLAILECCRVKMKNWIKYMLLAVHTSIMLLVLTCDSNRLFYTGVEWIEEGMFPHVKLGHALIYNLYTGLILIYYLIIIYVVAYRMKRIKTKIEKKQLRLMVAMVGTVILGLVLYLGNLTGGFDTTVSAYIIGLILLSVAIFKYRLLDTVSFAKDDALECSSDGFVVTDNDDTVIYSNKKAIDIRSTIENYDKNKETEHLKDYAQNKKLMINSGRVYEVTQKDIVRDRYVYGMLFKIHDATDHYNYSERLEREVKEKTEQISAIQRSVLGSFASIIEARDYVTGAHIRNTSRYVSILVKAVSESEKYKNQIDDKMAELIVDAAPMHDIGKISVPDHILNKPGKLTAEEFAIMKTHSEKGMEIIRDTLAGLEDKEYVHIAENMAYYHHEKWDGSGYPCGLKGEEIPLCARIMAVADVYDALRSKRSYKESMPKEKADEILRADKGTHFEPELVDLFLQNIN